MSRSDSTFAPLERWSPRLFIIAGAVLIIFASHSALQTFTGTTYPVVQELIAPFGFWLGMGGLLGLYPAIKSGPTRLARIGAVVVGVGLLNWSVILIKNLGGFVGAFGELGALTMATGILSFLTMFFSYVIFGLAGYRSANMPRAVWGLSLLEGLVWLHILVVFMTPLSIPLFVFEIGHFVSHLGIGITLLRIDGPRSQVAGTQDVSA